MPQAKRRHIPLFRFSHALLLELVYLPVLFLLLYFPTFWIEFYILFVCRCNNAANYFYFRLYEIVH